MSAVVKGLAALLVCSVFVVMWQQYRQMGLQQRLMDVQTEVNERLISNLDNVVAVQEATADSVIELLQSQQSIQRNLSTRTTEIRRLQSEVSEIRDWADSPLPDAIARLRSRQGIAGATAYGAAVPPSGAVHTDGDSTEN